MSQQTNLSQELLELIADCENRLDRLWGLSGLPDKPDVQAAHALVAELQERFALETGNPV